ncbi:bifunctional methylenetetrahydrofolate dehydrogenase/methenyltetrahydrofolate cyclohydrolase FolD [Nocardia sp. R6R-6]|uniref:bifunctional methylenetetrahydrofolate dehydrogenase/methenyltetrahydrofolate cyclohydrolase FolD n=1 Tax=Nocardia sp. R6R-6 TaxID=3459303 RepID=UPI00403E1900
MTANVIDGKAVAQASQAQTAKRVAEFVAAYGFAPGLATILIGEDPASEVYVRNKRKAAAAAGLADFHEHLPATATQDEVEALIDRLNAEPRVAGILLQLPVPGGLDRTRLIERIAPGKDVDGLTTLNQGRLARGVQGLRPCTPSGIIELLDFSGVSIEGSFAVVVGRSELVGHPVAELLLQRNATIAIAHSRTRDLAALTAQADILIAAAGVPEFIGAEHVKRGAAVIDVGIHRTDKGLTGDVRFGEVAEVAGWITPVPGGVGPMTIAALLSNTIAAAEVAAAGSAS